MHGWGALADLAATFGYAHYFLFGTGLRPDTSDCVASKARAEVDCDHRRGSFTSVTASSPLRRVTGYLIFPNALPGSRTATQTRITEYVRVHNEVGGAGI